MGNQKPNKNLLKRRGVHNSILLFAGVFAIVLVTAVVWAIMALALGGIPAVDLMSQPWLTHSSFLFFLIGIIIGAGLAFSVVVWRDHRSERITFAKLWRQLDAIYWVVFVGIVAFFALAIFARDASSPFNGPWMLLKFLTDSLNTGIGAWLSIFFGSITVWGVLGTKFQLESWKSTIRSFDEFFDLLVEMVKGAGPDKPVKMITYTPAIGAIALRGTRFRQFMDLITQDGKGSFIQMICLEPSALVKWHNSFVGRRTHKGIVTDEIAAGATKNAERIVRVIEANAYEPPNADPNRPAAPPVTRVKLNRLPGYYAFFTSSEAILVMPLYLPFNSGAGNTDRMPQVQMIGYRTTDRAILYDLREFFALCADNNGDGEHTIEDSVSQDE